MRGGLAADPAGHGRHRREDGDEGGEAHRSHPGVGLNLLQAASDQLIELVRTGRVEVAFLSPPAPGVRGR